MKTDIEIAQAADIQPITKIAEKIGLSFDDIELYGKYKAKIPLEVLDKFDQQSEGKLVLVTSINPTPAGEGKSTVTVGLADAFARQGKNVMVALREPSLGPVMGIKGGAAGGGLHRYYQWKILIFILQGIFMRLQLPIMLFRHFLIIRFIKEIR